MPASQIQHLVQRARHATEFIPDLLNEHTGSLHVCFVHIHNNTQSPAFFHWMLTHKIHAEILWTVAITNCKLKLQLRLSSDKAIMRENQVDDQLNIWT